MKQKRLSDFFEKTGTYVKMTPREQQISDRKNFNKIRKNTKN